MICERQWLGWIVAVLVLAGWRDVEASELEVRQVAPGVYALVGELGQRSPKNLGNNATFGAVVTADGIIVIDPGGSRAGADVIERAVRAISDQPVIAVINTGGQDHRWLGNAAFKAKGARLLASSAAIADQRARADAQIQQMRTLIGLDGFSGTEPLQAEEVIDSRKDLVVGGAKIVLLPAGHAHTPGSLIVWLPDTRIAFAGDIVYTERMLGVLDVSRSREWLGAFEILASLQPASVVPGHGHVTSLDQAKAETYDYLVHLRQQVKKVIDAGGDINEAANVDQSKFLRLVGSDQLARRNAMQVFAEMEFE